MFAVKWNLVKYNLCYYAFFLVCCGCGTSYIVSVQIQCQASINTLSLCRGHSWRVRLAKQETLTPPGHLVSPLVCRGLWMSTVVLYCWCHSDSASVLLSFTLLYFRYYKTSMYIILCLDNWSLTTFLHRVISTCAFLVIMVFHWYHCFGPNDIDRGLWPKCLIINLSHNYFVPHEIDFTFDIHIHPITALSKYISGHDLNVLNASQNA